MTHPAHPVPAIRPSSLLGDLLLAAWTSTHFREPALADYASPHIARETRSGVVLLSVAAMMFLAQATVFAAWFGLGASYTYTYGLLALLAFHIRISCARVTDIRALNLLAMALLIVSGSSLVLLARQAGQLHMMLLLSVATLHMLIPLVPWGLREAMATSAAIYVMFTSLTFFSQLHFGRVELWALQLTMLTTALVSLGLVARTLGLRKHDLATRFGLEKAHEAMAQLADRDHLTGAWNRRFLERDFEGALARHAAAGAESHFGVLDIDSFKQLNDGHGHRHGDAVLQALACAFASLDGHDEYLVRLGGDEFAFLLCGHGAVGRVEAMLARAAPLSCPADGQPTFSGGMIRLTGGGWTLARAYACADELLYAAKHAGGNAIRHRATFAHEVAA